MADAAVAARAKINLVLEVTGRRPDGYHEVDTILQELEVADAVTVSFDGEPGVAVAGPFAAGTPANASNLAWRAGEALARITGREFRASILVEKNIPPAAGLGGGSSDAAAVLRFLARVWPRVTAEMLTEAASATGSDVAFFLRGGTARATGRGERLQTLRPLPRHGVVLFVPPRSIEAKTARLYTALAEDGFDPGGMAEMFTAIEVPRLSPPMLYNAFERVAFGLFPGLAELRADLEAAIGESVRLSGAGPALFWIGPEGRREAVAAAAAGRGCHVIRTATATGQL